MVVAWTSLCPSIWVGVLAHSLSHFPLGWCESWRAFIALEEVRPDVPALSTAEADLASVAMVSRVYENEDLAISRAGCCLHPMFSRAIRDRLRHVRFHGLFLKA